MKAILVPLFGLFLLAGADAQGRPDRWRDPKPDLPDISVRFIERLPRFPGTQVRYRVIDEGPSGNKGDGLPAEIVNPNDQKWPQPGKDVTFVAHIRNAGTRPTPRFDWYWVIDGEDQPGPEGQGWDEPLQPGEERTYSIRWRWKTGRHYVAFETNRDRKFPEISHKNNFVVDATDALSFHFFVQPGLYEWFSNVKNGLDSYSWDDWAQFQVREMNRMFRDEIHPATPGGIEIRVRLDKITMLPRDFVDPGGMHVPDNMTNVESGWDGLWGFTDGYLKKNEEGKNVYEQLPHWITGVEWSLMHELGHQLGQPDYYLLPVPKEKNLAFPWVAYDPPSWFRDQMMFSGNYAHDEAIGRGAGVWDSGYRFWGEHAARAFNRDGNLRRGFFGTFLVDIPEVTRLVFLDEENRPIPEAEVKLWAAVGTSYTNGVFPREPDRRGRTDATGSWTLTGSPWRVLLNWTNNGALQFWLRERGGRERIGWLNITHFNLAFWRGGQRRATIYVRVDPLPPRPAEEKPGS